VEVSKVPGVCPSCCIFDVSGLDETGLFREGAHPVRRRASKPAVRIYLYEIMMFPKGYKIRGHRSFPLTLTLFTKISSNL